MSGGEKFVKSGAADAANFIFNWINARRECRVTKKRGEILNFLLIFGKDHTGEFF